MFKIVHINAVIIGVILSNSVVAGCTPPSVRVTSTLSTILSGNTVCTSDAQEEHHVDGSLWDYKRGNGDLIDARSQIGNWELVTGNLVRYTYGTNIFDFSLFANQGGTTYSFCDGNIVVAEVTQIVSGIDVGCGFAQ